jgi:hypothetical protein
LLKQIKSHLKNENDNNKELQNNAPLKVLMGFSNYIQRYFQVKATKENNSVLPFAQVKNFLGELFTDKGMNATLIREVLKIPGKKIDKLTARKLEALAIFGKVISGDSGWLARIEDNFINIKNADKQKRTDDYRYKSLEKFFAVTQEDGSKVLDPNIAGAIAVAAYNFMVLGFEGDGWNSEQDIKRMLGKSPSEKLTDQDWKNLGEDWTLQSNAVSLMGDAIVKSLGLSLVKGVPIEERGKLSVA